MGRQAFEFGLRPKDQFKVMQHFDLNTNHLEVLNRLYTPLIGTQAVGLYHFMTQFVKESHNETLILSHYIFMNELKINLLPYFVEVVCIILFFLSNLMLSSAV